MQPRLLQLRRLVIGEAGRFPELGRTFYERGAGTHDGRAGHRLRAPRRARRSATRRSGPGGRPVQLVVVSTPLNRAMLLGDDEPPTPADLDRYADAGVRAFLAVYGVP